MVGSSVSDLTQWLPEEFTAKDFLINLDKKERREISTTNRKKLIETNIFS